MKDQVRTTKDVQRVVEQSLKANPKDAKKFWAVTLANGRKLTEIQCRWVDVPLHEIIIMKLSMLGHKHIIERKNCPRFVEFVQFKTALRGLRSTVGVPDKTTSRCIGWTDGIQEFVIRVDERTGERLGGIESYLLRQGHLHPQSNLLEKPSTIIVPQPVITVKAND